MHMEVPRRYPGVFMRYAGKVVVVTGGASGIGRACALRFGTEGAQVLIADVDDAGGLATCALIASAGGQARFQHTDVAVYEEVAHATSLAVEEWGRLDLMFNNAGTNQHAPLLEWSPADFSRVIQVNQCGVFYGILAAARTMVARGTGGCIINNASVYAYTASVGNIGYHAAKGAVRAMTQAAALELAPHGIRVVGVAPGGVDTPFVQGYKDAGLARHLAKRHMRGTLLDPEQIAGVVAFLGSDDADAINGTTVLADDGFVAFK
jgi:glucose 1-dehydrogenase